MKDIRDKDDIKIFVDAFYRKVQIDPTIGPVFAARIPAEKWPVHLERMYSFWNTVLFSVQDYRGSPFSKHASLPIESKHFSSWLNLFSNVMDQNFTGEKADEAKSRAAKMGAMFESKLNYLRDNNQHINLL